MSERCRHISVCTTSTEVGFPGLSMECASVSEGLWGVDRFNNPCSRPPFLWPWSSILCFCSSTEWDFLWICWCCYWFVFVLSFFIFILLNLTTVVKLYLDFWSVDPRRINNCHGRGCNKYIPSQTHSTPKINTDITLNNPSLYPLGCPYDVNKSLVWRMGLLKLI